MSPLFGKKQFTYALAELLEDGREIFNQEMKKIKYRDYRGKEPLIQILARVQPENEPPFEARIKAGIGNAILFKPGVRLRVRYEPGKQQNVVLEDETQAILDRNPQLIKTKE